MLNCHRWYFGDHDPSKSIRNRWMNPHQIQFQNVLCQFRDLNPERFFEFSKVPNVIEVQCTERMRTVRRRRLKSESGRRFGSLMKGRGYSFQARRSRRLCHPESSFGTWTFWKRCEKTALVDSHLSK